MGVEVNACAAAVLKRRRFRRTHFALCLLFSSHTILVCTPLVGYGANPKSLITVDSD